MPDQLHKLGSVPLFRVTDIDMDLAFSISFSSKANSCSGESIEARIIFTRTEVFVNFKMEDKAKQQVMPLFKLRKSMKWLPHFCERGTKMIALKKD